MKYIKAFLFGVLIYLFGLILIILCIAFGFEGIARIRGEHETLALIITFCLPFIMVFSTDFKKSFGFFALSLFIANAVFPALDWSYGSPYPKFGKMTLNARTSPLDDSSYSGNDSNCDPSGRYIYEGVDTKTEIFVTGDSWTGNTTNNFGSELDYFSGSIVDSKLVETSGNYSGRLRCGYINFYLTEKGKSYIRDHFGEDLRLNIVLNKD